MEIRKLFVAAAIAMSLPFAAPFAGADSVNREGGKIYIVDRQGDAGRSVRRYPWDSIPIDSSTGSSGTPSPRWTTQGSGRETARPPNSPG
jgi:hypothetical protein